MSVRLAVMPTRYHNQAVARLQLIDEPISYTPHVSVWAKRPEELRLSNAFAKSDAVRE